MCTYIYIYVYIHTYIYIYIERERERDVGPDPPGALCVAPPREPAPRGTKTIISMAIITITTITVITIISIIIFISRLVVVIIISSSSSSYVIVIIVIITVPAKDGRACKPKRFASVLSRTAPRGPAGPQANKQQEHVI